ncbi:hypothetical protein C8R47DRAFT_1230346 [Mycena vitilis]|nr:hypothetical protein C8R47DRAFT_1230346 [Mycena vitilis]
MARIKIELDPAKDDVDAVLATLGRLNLGSNRADTPPRSPPPVPRHTRPPPPSVPSSPATAASRVQPTSPSHFERREYHYQAPGVSGHTESWDLAAHLTQGVSGATAHRLTPKKKKARHHINAYAVFVGTVPGAYNSWSEVHPLITGVSGAIQQGYSGPEEALAAYEYARIRGWTRVAFPSSPPIVAMPPRLLTRLPTPISPDDEANPLHDPRNGGLWYIVYAGIEPGVYQSYLECALNTLSIPGSRHDSCSDRDTAFRDFETAVRYRLRLKSAPPQEREASLQRAREARARYREKNRSQLLTTARCKRIGEFGRKYGLAAFEAKIERRIARKYAKAERRRRKSRVQAKGKPRRAPAQSSGSSGEDGEDEDEDDSDSDPGKPMRGPFLFASLT